MIEVKNRKIIRKISFRSFRANRVRNIIAICAIMLTAILFTSLFTVVASLNNTLQQQTMRMVGGSAHGSLKYLTKEQLDQFKVHPLIKEYGTSLMLAMPEKAPFNKHHTELRYGDDNEARIYFSYPSTGRMPRSQDELATDTAVLDLLGVPHKLGAKITLTYPLGDKEVTDTFTLCGFWESDKVSLASQVWLSEDYVQDELASVSLDNIRGNIIGKWNLDLMFKSSNQIENNILTILRDNGYTDNASMGDMDYGVNPAYTAAHLNSSDSAMAMAAVAAILLLILVTGYLIIYNIFQISVANDIRFYGLVKTIGATRRQIKRMLYYQAMVLTILAVPFGLFAGYLIGCWLTPLIMRNMSITNTYLAMNPWVFIGAAIFSMLTVVISCRKPAKLAGCVSPIEALRYTEGNSIRRKVKRSGKYSSRVLQMASANLKRSKRKTVIVILSLSLSLVLLNTAYSFAMGFDMDKFLNKFAVTDFIAGSADYFRDDYVSDAQGISEDYIAAINKQEGITEAGRVYGYTKIGEIYLDKERYKQQHSYFPPEVMEKQLKNPTPDGTYRSDIHLYGLEELPMSQLTVLEGSLDQLKASEHDIIQVVFPDDYGKPELDGAAYQVGDKVKLHYCTDYDIDENGEITEKNGYDIEYKIAATVMMPGNMSYRYYGSLQFALAKDTFIKDTGTSNTMTYLFNTDKEHRAKLEAFMKDYTEKIEPSMSYESKGTYLSSFKAFQNMFLIIGGLLSLIIGIIGILNFINVELTGILTRRREFAVLQSIGMEGKQLNRMLVYEGLFYGVISVLTALIISGGISLLLQKPLESFLWFYTFRFTVLPILLLLPAFAVLGVAIPLISYHVVKKHSVVERLRETE